MRCCCDAAIAFIEFLATNTGQELLTAETREFPILPEAEQPSGLDRLPAFKESDLPLAVLGEHQNEAQSLYLHAGWD